MFISASVFLFKHYFYCFLFLLSLIAGVTILLSLTVFLNLVAESMPTTSDAVPLIGTLKKKTKKTKNKKNQI